MKIAKDGDISGKCLICGKDTIIHNVPCPDGRSGCCVLHWDNWCPYCKKYMSKIRKERTEKAEKEELEWYCSKYKNQFLEAKKLPKEKFDDGVIRRTIERLGFSVSEYGNYKGILKLKAKKDVKKDEINKM